MNRTERLRTRLATGELLVVPGCQDALGARMIELAGFEAAYMTGFGTSAALLGQPDIGLLSAAEMTDNARRIAAATALPVIADADTGYGNPLNVARTVRDYASAGVSAIQLEDQVAPKRCGHMDDKAVIPTTEMVGKIRAASDAAGDDGPIIIARTDARAPEGVDEALERARAYAEAGADVLFVEALRAVEEFAAVGAAGLGRPLVYNWVDGGKSPELTSAEVADLGYSILLLPISVLLRAAAAMQDVLSDIAAHGVPSRAPQFEAGGNAFDAFTDLVGLPQMRATEQRYAED